MSRPEVGIGVIGFGWMGQAHSRSYLRIPTLFPERTYDPRLVICADNVTARRDEAVGSFGFGDATEDWRTVIEHPDVEVVVVTAPNMLHEELCVAAAAAGKQVFCEKPVGGTPEQTAAWAPVTFAPDLNPGIQAALPAGVTFIDPLARLCQLSACPYRRDGQFIFWDEGHLSAYGSSLAVETYFPYVE